jgi:hypothetical protein
MVGSSEITWSFFPIGVGVPFIVVVFVNAGLRRYVPGPRTTGGISWPVDTGQLSYFGLGAVAYMVLSLAQHRFH